jgi:hypothetical protein
VDELRIEVERLKGALSNAVHSLDDFKARAFRLERERDIAEAEAVRLRADVAYMKEKRDEDGKRILQAEAELAKVMESLDEIAHKPVWDAESKPGHRTPSEVAEAALAAVFAPKHECVQSLRAEVERLREELNGAEAEVTVARAEYKRQLAQSVEETKQAEAKLAEEMKAQDEVVALLHKQIEEAEDKLAEVVEALEDARDFAETERKVYANPNFTDRYGDADRCERMRDKLSAALAAAKAEGIAGSRRTCRAVRLPSGSWLLGPGLRALSGLRTLRGLRLREGAGRRRDGRGERQAMKVWRVKLNVPSQSVGHVYDTHDVSAPSAAKAITKVKKHLRADGLGRPYVSAIEELSDPE